MKQGEDLRDGRDAEEGLPLKKPKYTTSGKTPKTSAKGSSRMETDKGRSKSRNKKDSKGSTKNVKKTPSRRSAHDGKKSSTTSVRDSKITGKDDLDDDVVVRVSVSGGKGKVKME